MKVTLIRPARLYKLYNKTLQPSPPLGLALIAGALEAAGHQITVIDAIVEKNQILPFKEGIVLNGLTNAETIERIPTDTEVIGISCMFTQDWLNVKQLINEIGDAFANAIIIAGGEHITALPEFSMTQCPPLQVCALGEGEETVVELCNALQNGTGLETVQGVVYRDSAGALKRTDRRSRIKDVDNIVLPAWHLLPVESYFEEGLSWGVGVKRSLPLLATRGCPYSCTFCSSPNMWGTRYYMRDPQKVVDEIENLIRQYRLDGVELFDLTAVISAKWIVEFAKELLKRNIKITWQLPSGTRSEAITREVAHYMNLSGCSVLSYAPESGSEETLKLVKKKVNLNKLLKAVADSNKEKLIVKVNIIIGLPNERHRQIWQTLWFLVKCSWYGAYDMVPSPFYPYPGSVLFKELVEKGKISLEGEEYYKKLVNAQNLFKIDFFNDHVSTNMLRVYFLMYLLTFYLSNYLFRPQRLFKTVGNIIMKTPQSRGQATIIDLSRQYASFLKNALSLKEKKSPSMQHSQAAVNSLKA